MGGTRPNTEADFWARVDKSGERYAEIAARRLAQDVLDFTGGAA